MAFSLQQAERLVRGREADCLAVCLMLCFGLCFALLVLSYQACQCWLSLGTLSLGVGVCTCPVPPVKELLLVTSAVIARSALDQLAVRISSGEKGHTRCFTCYSCSGQCVTAPESTCL